MHVCTTLIKVQALLITEKNVTEQTKSNYINFQMKSKH